MSHRRFIKEFTQKSPSNVGDSFVNKKARFIDHTVYIYPYRYMRGVPLGGVSRTVSRKMVSRFDGRMALIESK
jgi:hypothetical protein